MQKQGRNSYITYWERDVPLGRTTFTKVGKSKSRSASIRTLTYENWVIFAVGSSQWIGFPIMLASFEKQIGVQHFRGKFRNLSQVSIFVILVAKQIWHNFQDKRPAKHIARAST